MPDPLLTPELLRRLARSPRSPVRFTVGFLSAERMNVNRRGWQPTERRSPSRSTLKGWNNAYPGPNGPALPGPGPVRVRSRGCQRTEPHRRSRRSLMRSNCDPFSPRPPECSHDHRTVRPVQGRTRLTRPSVGSTHGYSPGSPPVYRGVRRFQNADSILVNCFRRLAIRPSHCYPSESSLAAKISRRFNASTLQRANDFGCGFAASCLRVFARASHA